MARGTRSGTRTVLLMMEEDCDTIPLAFPSRTVLLQLALRVLERRDTGMSALEKGFGTVPPIMSFSLVYPRVDETEDSHMFQS